MEVLDCYRVLRIYAKPDEWEQAIKSIGSEVQGFVRRRLEEHARDIRNGERHPDSGVCITFGEPPYRHTTGRSIEYLANQFKRNGCSMNWQYSGNEFTPSYPEDGRRRTN